MSDIHASAVVEPGATLGQNVKVGPFCYVGQNVTLGDDVVLESHVAINGKTRVGARTQIFPFAAIGYKPQDLKFGGEDSVLEIGTDCTIRENVTMNPGTEGGGLTTRIGDHCLLMAGSHVAHDCQVGSHVIFANNATLAGHCSVGDFAILGGLSAVHQFVRIGAHAFIGGMSGVEHDVIPYGSVIGNRAHLGGLNIVGLKRRGFARDDIHALRKAYRMLFSNEGTLKERLDDVAKTFPEAQLVADVVAFMQAGSDRSFCTPRS